MSKITQKIENLREVINSKDFDKGKSLRFLSSIESDVKDLEKKYINLKEDAFDEDYTGDTFITIDGGIGKINYNADNLALQDVMENLEKAIQKHTPNKVNRALTTLI